MPFLQMLQSVESPPFTEANLLRLQHHKTPWDHHTHTHNHNLNYYLPENEMGLDPESCLTQSPVRSETKDPQQADGGERRLGGVSDKREKRKRSRTRRTMTVKDKKEVESQRMTHIAVERNRRRQMNHHLAALRSLMPPSYIQRGDQASIIGGAIDLVKELEQLLQSLQTQKRRMKADEAAALPFNGMLALSAAGVKLDENNWAAGNVQVRVIQNHVNLKIECERTPGHLVRAIVGLEELRLTVLHLTITSLETSSVHYSFSLKIEDDCKVGSAEEIAGAVHQLFSFINGS